LFRLKGLIFTFGLPTTNVVTVYKCSLMVGFGKFLAKDLGFSLDLIVLMNAL